MNRRPSGFWYSLQHHFEFFRKVVNISAVPTVQGALKVSSQWYWRCIDHRWRWCRRQIYPRCQRHWLSNLYPRFKLTTVTQAVNVPRVVNLPIVSLCQQHRKIWHQWLTVTKLQRGLNRKINLLVLVVSFLLPNTTSRLKQNIKNHMFGYYSHFTLVPLTQVVHLELWKSWRTFERKKLK
jgi:hypothetical protein